MKTVDYKLSEFLTQYLINNDESGYKPLELEAFKEWLTNENVGHCLGIVAEAGFCRTNDYDNLGSNCFVYRFKL